MIYESTDGFEIARQDLAIRGPGEFLGARQSGVPMLRFADLERDTALIEQARDAADELIAKFPDAAQAHLARGQFPGNVRELRNVLERALVLADGPGCELDVQHLRSFEQEYGHTYEADVEEPKAPPSRAVIESLEATERRQIERALVAVGGNRKEAATRLGIGLRTLYEKLKRYQIG